MNKKDIVPFTIFGLVWFITGLSTSHLHSRMLGYKIESRGGTRCYVLGTGGGEDV